MNRVSVYDCSFIELPRITVEERKGSLTPVYNNVQLPFKVKRVFYTYDIPGGEARGAHAHKECHQFLIAAGGSFEVVLDDGVNTSYSTRYLGIRTRFLVWCNLLGISFT